MSERTIDFEKERIPDGEFRERLQRVQQGLTQEGLAVGLAFALSFGGSIVVGVFPTQ